MEDLVINSYLIIPASELQATFSRSGGPGGQNVNKVNTKATLSWNLLETQVLFPTTMARLKVLAGSKVTDAGILSITSSVHREQIRNLEACRERLKRLVLEACKAPVIRKPTRPTLGSQRRRLDAKRIEGKKKQERKERFD